MPGGERRKKRMRDGEGEGGPKTNKTRRRVSPPPLPPATHVQRLRNSPSPRLHLRFGFSPSESSPSRPIQRTTLGEDGGIGS